MQPPSQVDKDPTCKLAELILSRMKNEWGCVSESIFEESISEQNV